MKHLALAILLLINLMIAGCQKITGGILQVSTLDALNSGNYDGQTSLDELSTYGDMGLGTFHRLDGEMILVNGDFYQTNINKPVSIPPGAATTPFAIVTRFEPTIRQKINRPLTLSQLTSYLDRLVPDQNVICFYYIRGQFEYMKTQTLPAQRKPYPPVITVRRSQRIVEANNVYGSLIGVRIPPSFSGINKPGFTFHFLNEARNYGGFVLDAMFEDGEIRIDSKNEWFQVDLPLL
jgi:acetolactate decarboxylase